MINVSSCKIIPPDTDNVSDHRPLRLPMELHVPLAEAAVTIDQSKQVPVTYWNRQMNNKRYNKELDAALCELHPMSGTIRTSDTDKDRRVHGLPKDIYD